MKKANINNREKMRKFFAEQAINKRIKDAINNPPSDRTLTFPYSVEEGLITKGQQEEIDRGKNLQTRLIFNSQILGLAKDEVQRNPYSIQKRREFVKTWERFSRDAIIYGGINSKINPFLEYAETTGEEYKKIIRQALDSRSNISDSAEFYRKINKSLLIDDLSRKKLQALPVIQ